MRTILKSAHFPSDVHTGKQQIFFCSEIERFTIDLVMNSRTNSFQTTISL